MPDNIAPDAAFYATRCFSTSKLASPPNELGNSTTSRPPIHVARAETREEKWALKSLWPLYSRNNMMIALKRRTREECSRERDFHARYAENPNSKRCVSRFLEPSTDCVVYEGGTR